MLLPWIVLCTTFSLAVGYGYDYDYGSKEECRKLKHYDVDSRNDGHLNRKAKFTHLERHGKDYTMITCPNDSFMYSLVAEHEGSVFNIFGSEYRDTVVLAAGFNVGVAAKCDGKRTTVTTTDGKKIKIKKVACVQYTSKVSFTPTTTVATTTVNPCTFCDFQTIKPSSTPAGIIFKETETTKPGECRQYEVTCKRDDNQVCTQVSISAPTAMGNSQLGYLTGAGLSETKSVTVDCQADGTWKSGFETITSNMECKFVGCAPPVSCADCKIGTIEPISTPDGSIFDSSEIAGSCKKYTVTCKRTDNQVCTEVVLKAPTAMGLTTIGAVTAPGVTQTSTTVDCKADGKWASGTAVITGSLQCSFTGCAPPPSCTDCNINSIEPTSTPAGVVYAAVETTEPGGCKKYTVICKRTDNLVCTQTNVYAPTATGYVRIGSTSGSQTSATVQCQTNGRWKAGDAIITSNLYCEVVNCVVPPSCKDCDIKTITPSSLPVGTDFVPSVIPGACVQYGLVCKRTDDQVCSSVKIRAANIYATSSAGTVIAAQNSGTTTSSTAQCSANGQWVIGGLTPVNRLDCIFEGCAVPPSCTSCDFNAIKPLSTPDGVIFEEDKIIGSCNKYQLTCKRVDGKVCTQAWILAIADWGGLTNLGYKIGSGLTETSYTLNCREDGKWEGLGEIIVTNLVCAFSGCQ